MTLVIADHAEAGEKLELVASKGDEQARKTIEIIEGMYEVHKMGMSEVTICYGQTETSPVITQTRVDDPLQLRVETVGRAHPDVEVRIIDPNSGKEVPRGVQGELCTRGYHVMKGYYKNPGSLNG